VSDLVVQLDLPQPRVSSHLAVLRDAGLVTHRRSGRQRTYGVDAVRVGTALDALRSLTPPPSSQPRRSAQADREVRRDSAIRRARTCYDHLAGVAAIDLLDEFTRCDWLTATAGERTGFRLTDAGSSALAARGVDVERAGQARRRFAFGCLDWTERRPHLGGALGAEVLRALERAGRLRRVPGSRVVELHEPIESWLADHRIV
jgi:DNA-binding transcriptional ArsR family regulator